MIFIFLIGKNHGFSKIITDDPKFAWSNPMSSGLWGIIHDHVHRFFLVKHYIYIFPQCKTSPIFLINSSEIISFPYLLPWFFHVFPWFSHGFSPWTIPIRQGLWPGWRTAQPQRASAAYATRYWSLWGIP